MPFEIILSLVAWKSISLEQATSTRVLFLKNRSECEIVIYSKILIKSICVKNEDVNHFNSEELRIV